VLTQWYYSLPGPLLLVDVDLDNTNKITTGLKPTPSPIEKILILSGITPSDIRKAHYEFLPVSTRFWLSLYDQKLERLKRTLYIYIYVLYYTLQRPPNNNGRVVIIIFLRVTPKTDFEWKSQLSLNFLLGLHESWKIFGSFYFWLSKVPTRFTFPPEKMKKIEAFLLSQKVMTNTNKNINIKK